MKDGTSNTLMVGELYARFRSASDADTDAVFSEVVGDSQSPYTTGGIFEVIVTIRDDDGGSVGDSGVNPTDMPATLAVSSSARILNDDSRPNSTTVGWGSS